VAARGEESVEQSRRHFFFEDEVEDLHPDKFKSQEEET
jgi:hypothetical protein